MIMGKVRIACKVVNFAARFISVDSETINILGDHLIAVSLAYICNSIFGHSLRGRKDELILFVKEFQRSLLKNT